MTPSSPKEVATKRPAETLTAGATTAALLAKLFGLDTDVAFYIVVLLGYAPAAITATVVFVRGLRKGS